VAALAALVLALVTRAPSPVGAAPVTPQQADDGWYVPPVDAPIADPFRPPAAPYGPGNRGLEYDTAPGDPVVASAAGTVVFAGAVAGALHVTVLHGDGLRTSYSYLADISVTVGGHVAQGDELGTAGERLHFGARAGDAYLDPAALFTQETTVELLPFEVPPGSTPDAEARALVGLTLGRGPSLPDVGAAVSWLRDRAGDTAGLVRGPLAFAAEHGTVGRGLAVAGDLAAALLFAGPCSSGPPPARPAAADRRVAVTVAGLGSTSEAAAIDDLRTDELGYAPGAVVRFSYAGGRTPGTGGADAGGRGIAARPYTSADTQGDVRVAARRLADLVEQVAAADPAATLDVYAHSLGGIVARLALVELERRGFDLTRLGLVATFASPHGGADVATAVAGLARNPVAGEALDGVSQALDLGLDPDAIVVAQLAETSDVVSGLSDAGVPAGVRLLSIGGRGDLVVPAPRTRVEGAANVTVPATGVSAHSDVVGSDAASAELARALAGEPPGCEAWPDAVADVVVGHATAAVEDDIGLVLGAPG